MGQAIGGEWRRYGVALIGSMREVLDESPEELHALVLETAEYWLSLGLAIGLGRPPDAERLLSLIAEDDVAERAEIDADAATFCAEGLR